MAALGGAAAAGFYRRSGDRRHRRLAADLARRRSQLLDRAALAIDRRLAMGEESLPRDALRIGDPLLVGIGVAASHRGLRDDRPLGLLEAVVDLRQLG